MAKSKTNEQAIKLLVKNLTNTPHNIGLAIMRERLLNSAEQSKKSMAANPEKWANPFISEGMYYDYFNRVIDILKFD